ncbi:PIG-L deacetylase family protein [Streptomyces zagrosensis]|uniref:LmbE family N-acetylglucosaminyl deacetylase n=1 Tax=Streptomyces zagrosensis TaxID=1042984 RepID=A0A7W9QBI9_9ACTN|nr:PIG-L family deacetylase [Streptomyces zagrosensis]MBB5936864.1 LmbE family N-acetylglucosaminyl deacetylase [Streptomyces zagrosensis]
MTHEAKPSATAPVKPSVTPFATAPAVSSATTPPNAPRWRTVVLSPHFDDAVLSLAAVIPRLRGPVVVVTVYGGEPGPEAAVSGWDERCGFGTPHEAYEARSVEDALALDMLGVSRITLPHPDGPYGGADQLGHLDQWLRDLPDGIDVLAPLGTRQAHHAFVREQALLTRAAQGAPLPLIYADLPYTGHAPGWHTDAAEAALAAEPEHGESYRSLTDRYRLSVRWDVRLDDAQWARKRLAVQCYGSQLAPLGVDHGPFLSWSGPLRTERVWSLEQRS